MLFSKVFIWGDKRENDLKLSPSTIISRAFEATILTAQQIYLESQAVKNQNNV